MNTMRPMPAGMSEESSRARGLGLTSRVLALLVGFVILAEIAIYVPFLANFRTNWLLTRLSAVETGRYIQHRLTEAGAKRTIFESSAVEAIQQLTHGIPRRINRLCDLALLVGYGEELRTLTSQHIESIQQELIGTAAAA